jgi:hypothetical protein
MIYADHVATIEEKRKIYRVLRENMKTTYRLKYLGEDGRFILKQIIKQRDGLKCLIYS